LNGLKRKSISFNVHRDKLLWLMNFTDIVLASDCMRLEAISKKIRRVRRDRNRESIASLAKYNRFTKKQIAELLFENCIGQSKKFRLENVRERGTVLSRTWILDS